MKKDIEEVLDKEVRPGLRMDGGDIQLIDVDEKAGIVKVHFTGGCAGCPMSQLTLTGFVEKVLKSKVKGVKAVILV
ncbi:MAG: NifU family protein [Candidatus Thermoplasmatota archaeon]